ncbi:MAG: NfeD family protein [Gammaproteobacteria bacterium]|jgi:membrane protein implicated in regulation of membrane protease activity
MASLTFAPTFWQWWILGLVLVILEVFAPGAFLIWIGISAGMVGLLLLFVPAVPWQLQVLMFGVFSVAIVLVWRRYLQAHPVQSEVPFLNRRGEQYVGRVLTLDDPIVNGIGRLRIDDSIWRIRGEDCPAQSKVTITGVDGVVLTVDRYDASPVSSPR